ncbi:MAG: FecR domain-containing protein [Pseudomonadota bacterium]
MLKRVLLAGAAMSLVAGGSFAAENVGVAAAVVRDATGTLGADTRALAPGSSLLRDETIRTGANSKVQVLFQDETALSIGPDAEVTLDEFVYDPVLNQGTFSIDAARGAFRFISGNLSSASYAIETPIATIGVRGTVLDVFVAPSGEVTVTLIEGGAVISALGGAGGAAGEAGGGTVELTTPGQTTTIAPDGLPTEPEFTQSIVELILDQIVPSIGDDPLVDPEEIIIRSVEFEADPVVETPTVPLDDGGDMMDDDDIVIISAPPGDPG